MHTYPIRLEGRLDPGLSRWQWLVIWLLAIPHYVILAFLLLAFAVLTVVAGFSIAFTGRYPRSIPQVQCGRDALDLAGELLHLQRAWHRPVPALNAGRDRLPGQPRRVAYPHGRPVGWRW